MKNLPHLNYIRSFEAAARHLSFTSAAAELNYTQAAISNHVRALEDYIGRPLFHRFPRSLALTELGEAYLPAVRQALGQIDIATEAIVSRTRSSKVAISCPVSLAENWLPARIARFRAKYPQIDISVHATVWTDVGDQVADIKITLEHKETPPDGASLLWPEKIAIVCAPSYVGSSQKIVTPHDVVDADLIHILGRQDYWVEFAREYDLSDLRLDGGIKTDASNIALELAAHGLGLAAVPRSLIATYVDRGLLVEPFECDISSPWSYYLAVNTGSRGGPARQFADWLTSNSASA